MHPAMQRRLMSYLSRNTTNQYLITTHSSALLDQRRVSIFYVERHDGASHVSKAAKPDDLVELVQELGYKASDILQSNVVIWVEGPSDRLYLNYWLELLAPELIEGADYTIMFYGGMLVNHLTAEGETDFNGITEDFIRLCTINRNFVLLTDSDRQTEGTALAETKMRLSAEVEGNPNRIVWITDGYTIENYVPVDVLRQAVNSVHPRTQFSWDGDPGVNPLAGFAAKKVPIARAATRIWGSDAELDQSLKVSMEKVIALVRKASQLD